MTDDKIVARKKNMAEGLKILADSGKLVVQAHRKAIGMTMQFTKKRITATKGPTCIFQGRLLGSNRIGEQGFDEWIESELWETPAGAWVAVLAYRYEDSGRDFVLAGVVPPDDDQQSRVFAALDIMEWNICAKSMMSKKKFSLVVKVD